MNSAQQFVFEEVTTIQQIVDNWPFFLEGLQTLNRLVSKSELVEPETLLKTLCHTISLSDGRGLLTIVRSKSGKELLWLCALENTGLFKPRSCAVYAVYSNKKAEGVVAATMLYFETWAREKGYKRIQAFSPCFNGSRFRLFEKVWKFSRTAVLFTKEL